MNATQEIASVNTPSRRSLDSAETPVREPPAAPAAVAAPEAPKLKVENLNAWYGTNHALHGVNLTVPPGP